MMNKRVLNVMVGIPGSGKSTYIRNNKSEDDEVICPDQIRKEITGDISDQSQNRKVWETAYKRLMESKSDTVYFDATNLSKSTLKSIIDNAIDFGTINFLLLSTSYKRMLCKNRIKNDVENKVERSHVPDDIVDIMHKRFLELTQNIDSWIEEWENDISMKSITYRYINN